MNETILQFGCENHLVGVLSKPAANRWQATAIILLNSGMVHHVGPYRQNVLLGRAFAEAGFLALRVDLSGIGDSEWPASAATYEEQVVKDIRGAMDRIESDYDISRFVLIGICTGADNAHKTALVDSRVVGAVFMDGYTYPTLRYLIKRSLPVLLSPARLARALRYHLWEKHRANSDVAAPDELDQFTWTAPTRQQMAMDLEHFASRKLKLLYIYTHSWIDDYNYTSQLADAFRGVDFSNIQLEFWPEADHTYSNVNSRIRLINFVSGWLAINFRRVPDIPQLSHRPKAETTEFVATPAGIGSD